MKELPQFTKYLCLSETLFVACILILSFDQLCCICSPYQSYHPIWNLYLLLEVLAKTEEFGFKIRIIWANSGEF